MTIQVEHIPRTDGTGARLLPSWSDTAGWTAEKVAEIAGVDLAAHRLAHPVPQHACPFGDCAAVVVLFRDRSAETTWREDAAVSPVAREVAA
jgi:hypothetical protein